MIICNRRPIFTIKLCPRTRASGKHQQTVATPTLLDPRLLGGDEPPIALQVARLVLVTAALLLSLCQTAKACSDPQLYTGTIEGDIEQAFFIGKVRRVEETTLSESATVQGDSRTDVLSIIGTDNGVILEVVHTYKGPERAFLRVHGYGVVCSKPVPELGKIYEEVIFKEGLHFVISGNGTYAFKKENWESLRGQTKGNGPVCEGRFSTWKFNTKNRSFRCGFSGSKFLEQIGVTK